MARRSQAWSVAQAKARLSALIDQATAAGPQTITRHGKPAAIIVSPEQWAKRRGRSGTLANFFRNSPLYRSGLTFERPNDQLRDINL